MKNLETYILKQNRFNRHLVDNFTDEKKAMINKAPNRVTDFGEITQLISIIFLNMFIAKEDKQVCSISFETKKGISFCRKICFFLRYYRNQP